jgi:hypothetical protein
VREHRGRPEREHVVSAIATLQSVVIEDFALVAWLLSFEMLYGAKVAEGTTEGARNIVRLQYVPWVTRPLS